jgi:hypothetical protein
VAPLTETIHVATLCGVMRLTGSRSLYCCAFRSAAALVAVRPNALLKWRVSMARISPGQEETI